MFLYLVCNSDVMNDVEYDQCGIDIAKRRTICMLHDLFSVIIILGILYS